MKTMIVANDNGKMPKKYLKKLCKLANYDWKYDETAKCFSTEIENFEHAKFIAMKVIAVFTQELPGCFCAYSEDRKAIFFLDRFSYRKV